MFILHGHALCLNAYYLSKASNDEDVDWKTTSGQLD